MTTDCKLTYVDHVYNIVFMDTLELDSIYKDYIIQMVGVYGFNALHAAGYLESCGVINGRQLYVLVSRENSKN